MSRDIRSFFTVISKKPGSDSSKTEPTASPAPKKRAKRIIDSDDEDVINATPDAKHAEKKQKTQNGKSKDPHKHVKKTPESKKVAKKPAVLSSDSEEEVVKKQDKSKPSKLKPVAIVSVFSNTPVKQSKVDALQLPPKEKVESKKSKHKKNDTEKKVHNDADFEKTLDDLDDEVLAQCLELEMSKDFEPDEEIPASESTLDASTVNKKEQKKENINASVSEVKSRKRSRTDSSDKVTPKKKKLEQVDSGIDPGQEAHEKRRFSAILYQKYLNRSGPKNHGKKELPKGKSNCLNGLCFLKTGVLDSLASEEFEKLVKEHGGRVVHAVSKKVNYVVFGEEAGPAKLAKAEKYDIPTISEDELLDLILTKSGMEPKYANKNKSGSSEDLGVELNEVTDDTNKKTTPEKEGTKAEFKVSPKENKADEKPKNTGSSKIDKKPESNKKTEKPKDTNISQMDNSMLSLTEKYKPTTLACIIGQQGDNSNLSKLKNWLQNWKKNQDPNVRKTLSRPSPWAKDNTGAYFKCALLSGPPGVGKTTSATLVAKELGLDVVEFNASDTRSKRSLQEQVAQLLHTKTIAGFAKGQITMKNNRVLLMDEVDGMAGNEDRGGIQELIQLIKNTSVPIICMCNDRNHQKMRTLVNYCFDLKFPKPRPEQIKGAMLSICFKEKIDISPKALVEIIAGTGCDIRQTLNNLAILGSTKDKVTQEIAEKEAKSSKKDTVMGLWEVCRAVFTKSEHKDMSVSDRARLFFYDYSLGPLFVQENYLKVQPDGMDKKQTLLKAAFTASALSTGDIIESKIRKNNNWALLESQAFFSSVLPGHYMSGTITGQINFPSWLGKNSKKNKFQRMLSELQLHTRVTTSASKSAIKLDYLLPLRNAILSPLQKKGADGIQEAVTVMLEYKLLREDIDNIVELSSWVTQDNLMTRIDPKVKSAFTRAYNKNVTLLPYAPASGITKKRAAAAENELGEEEENLSDNEDDDDDISKNAMIKINNAASAKRKKTAASTSKKKEPKKGGKGKKA